MNGYLRALVNGGLFQTLLHWVYGIFAGLNLFFPIYLFYLMIDGDILDAKGKYVFLALLIWLGTAFAGWVGFQIWWAVVLKFNKALSMEKDFRPQPYFQILSKLWASGPAPGSQSLVFFCQF